MTMHPTYCITCGTKLKWGERTFAGFNEGTGKRTWTEKLICPARRWFQFSHYDPYKRPFRFKIYTYRTSEER